MTRLSTELVQRWRQGDEGAATALYERYCQDLRRVVAHNLSSQLNSKVDPDDILQTAFGTYFKRTRRGEFTFDSDADVWRLLVSITLNKVRLRARKFTTDKRDVSFEVHAAHDDASSDFLVERLSRKPGYMESIEFQRLLEQLLELLPVKAGQVLRLRVEGYTQEEIAQILNISERTVRRCVNEIRDIITRSKWFE